MDCVAFCDAVLTAWNGSGDFITGIALRFGEVSRGSLVSKDLGLRLATENTLVHSLAPVVNDIVVKEAKRVIVKFTLELPDGPLGYSPQTGDSSRSVPKKRDHAWTNTEH